GRVAATHDNDIRLRFRHLTSHTMLTRLGPQVPGLRPDRNRALRGHHPCSALLCRSGSNAAMGLRPARRVMHELFDLGELCGVELAPLLPDPQPVPPA